MSLKLVPREISLNLNLVCSAGGRGRLGQCLHNLGVAGLKGCSVLSLKRLQSLSVKLVAVVVRLGLVAKLLITKCSGPNCEDGCRRSDVAMLRSFEW